MTSYVYTPRFTPTHLQLFVYKVVEIMGQGNFFSEQQYTHTPTRPHTQRGVRIPLGLHTCVDMQNQNIEGDGGGDVVPLAPVSVRNSQNVCQQLLLVEIMQWAIEE